jgi:hypothetical protein
MLPMKTRLSAVLSVFALSIGSALCGAPLMETAAVQTRPDPAAPAITYLKAGSEPVVASNALATTPAGWMAVELPGPFEAYVTSNDVTKGLDVKVGTEIHLGPKADSPVLTVMEKGDKADITGLPKGKWLQIQLEKKITGYIRVGASTAMPVAPSSTPAASADMPTAAPAATYGTSEAGKPAPMGVGGDNGASTLPRLFQGKFVSTHRAFAPKRPYDFQLNDEAGVRFAYVDLSKLLETARIENYIDHTVVVYGTAKNVPDAKGIVIMVESLQLK